MATKGKKIKFLDSLKKATKENNNTSKLNKTEKIGGISFMNNSSMQKSSLINKTALRPVTGRKKGGKQPSKGSEEELIDEDNVQVGNLGEVETTHTKTMKSIDEALELFNSNVIAGKVKGSYELIDKEELKKMKENNNLMKKEKKDLGEVYNKLKEEYKIVENALEKITQKYAKVEKVRADSITKIYNIEEKLEDIMVENCKIQNEINFEKEEKNNVFRALAELKEKYSLKLPNELEEALKKLKKSKDFQGGTILNLRSTNQIKYLEDKIESLEKEIESRDKIIDDLENKKKSLQGLHETISN